MMTFSDKTDYIRFHVDVSDETPGKPTKLSLVKTSDARHSLTFHPDPEIYFEDCELDNFIVRQVTFGIQMSFLRRARNIRGRTGCPA